MLYHRVTLFAFFIEDLHAMTRDITITQVRITPIAFRDGPLLNAAGIHEPWALRAIVASRAIWHRFLPHLALRRRGISRPDWH